MRCSVTKILWFTLILQCAAFTADVKPPPFISLKCNAELVQRTSPGCIAEKLEVRSFIFIFFTLLQSFKV